MTDRIHPRRRSDARPSDLPGLRTAASRTLLGSGFRGHNSMTFNGWLQIALFSAVVILLVKPFGAYMTTVFSGERSLLSPVLGPVERAFYRLSGVDERSDQNWVTYAVSMLLFSAGGLPEPLCADASAGFPAVQSRGPVGGRRGPRLQHGDELRHQHQLAVLRARDDHELPRPDGGTHGAQLRLRRHGHRAGGCADPRLCPPVGQGHRQFLGRSGALHPLRPAADLHRRRPVLRLAGHAAESRRLYRGDDARRRQAGHRPGTGCLPGSHQDAGHQRWRLLQRQLRPSVREPQRHHQFRADGADLLDRRGADQRVRPHGRRPAPGLGGVRGHGPAVPRRRPGGLLGGSGRQSCFRSARPRRRQHGRQGSPLRHRQFRRCSPRSPPTLRAAP